MMMQDNEKLPYPVNPFKAVEELQKKLEETLNFDPFKNMRHFFIGGGERGADIGEKSGVNEITNQNHINIKAIVRQELWELNKVKVEDNGTPPAEAEEKKKKSTQPTFVVMLEVAETINKVDKFLPQNWINRTDKLAKYKKAIFDRFGFDYAESTIKNNFDTNLNDTHRLKVINMLNEFGFMNLATQYQLQYKCTA